MVGGLFAGRDPLDVVPERHRPRPGEQQARPMTPEEREIAQEVGLRNLELLLKGR